MAAVELPSLAPEAIEKLQQVREVLERQAARLQATGDPMGEAIEANAAVAAAFQRLIVDAFLKIEAHSKAVTTVVQASRQPMTREEVHAFCAHLDKWLMYRWTQFNRRAVAICVAVVLAFGAACWGVGFSMSSTRIEALNQAMTGPEAAHWLPLLKANNLAQAWSHCQPLPQPNGGKACSFALWTEQPPAQR